MILWRRMNEGTYLRDYVCRHCRFALRHGRHQAMTRRPQRAGIPQMRPNPDRTPILIPR